MILNGKSLNFLILNVLLAIIILNVPECFTWPDGAPCVHAVLESMNPLEAIEHQGGLQLTLPPFYIELDQKCYWRNQPIALTLRGNTTKDQFKGFAIQPLIYKGVRTGQRIGQFLRLDDNGSWQQQCFKSKDAVTHSHDEKKKRMQLWWKNDDDDSEYVQFVATVVVSLRHFWVKSVLSAPLPPCRVRNEGEAWQRERITPPPAVSNFKMDAFKLFNKERANFIEDSISRIPVDQVFNKKTPLINPIKFPTSTTLSQFVVAQTTPNPQFSRRRLNHIIPVQTLDMNRRPCRDVDTPAQCFRWTPFCARSAYMRNFCQRTCRFC